MGRRTMGVGWLLLAITLVGCWDSAPEPIVTLVAMPDVAVAGTQPGGQAVHPVTEQAPAGLSSDADIARFIAACERIQPVRVEADPEGRTNAYGQVFRGEGQAPPLPPPPSDGSIGWVQGNAEYLDPNLVAETAGTDIVSQFFEGLYVHAPGNTSPRPALATSHTVSPDGRVYTFALRTDARWSDGTALTAHDLRYSWLRGLHPETASRNAQQLWYVSGARDFNQGKTTDTDRVGIRVVDNHTLEVTLESPAPFFIDLLTYVSYMPVPRQAIEAHGKRWVRPEHIVVNGPYKPVFWQPRDKLVMERNETYWDRANVAIPRGEVIFSDDEARNVRLYDTGKVHHIRPLPEDKVALWITEGRSDLHIDQQMCTYYYVINVSAPPFDDVRVRRAMLQSIDRERLTRHILASMQLPATHLVPDMFRGTIGYVPPEGLTFDPPAAARLLAEVGYPNGAGMSPVGLTYNTFEIHRRIAEFVQRDLSQNLGVEVRANNMEWKSLLKKVHARDYDIARTSWCADYPDPMTFLSVFHSASESNYPGYKNPAYDALLGRIRSTDDRRDRNVLMCAAEKVLAWDAPIIPFYFYTRSYLLRDFVQGFEPHYLDRHLLKYMSIQP